MLELELERVEQHLRTRAQRRMKWEIALAALVGALLQACAWTSRAPWLSALAASLAFAAATGVAVLAAVDRARRRPPLIDRLRREPHQLCALSFRWVADLRGTHGQIGFQFVRGQSCFVVLPTDRARAAFHAFRTAYPWTRTTARAAS